MLILEKKPSATPTWENYVLALITRRLRCKSRLRNSSQASQGSGQVERTLWRREVHASAFALGLLELGDNVEKGCGTKPLLRTWHGHTVARMKMAASHC
jgi:hypothetical protein